MMRAYGRLSLLLFGGWLAHVAVAQTRSHKRGVAYALTSDADFDALTKLSWWYNWHHSSASAASHKDMEFVPMLWNFDFNAATITASILKHNSQHLLVLNEPNLLDQANINPTAAAEKWPLYEAIAASTGVKLVGPAITYGTLPGYSSPTVWLDEFFSAYRTKFGREPQVDYLAVHWYDYGLEGLLDSLKKYGKQFWVTEIANWHWAADWKIDTAEKQKATMSSMVSLCESRADVYRYAWFTGRNTKDGDRYFSSLFESAAGTLSAVGQHYLSLPYTELARSPPPPAPPPVPPAAPPRPPMTPYTFRTCSQEDEPGWQCVCCLERGCILEVSMPAMCETKRCCHRVEDTAYNPEQCCGPAGWAY